MIEKHKKPFSEPSNLFLANVDDFLTFAIVKGKFIGEMKSENSWKPIEVAPGSLRPSCLDNGNGTYSIDIRFRVPFASHLNNALLTQLSKHRHVARYTSQSGVEMMAGTVENFLKLEFSKPENFDGYDCTLKGIQTTPECFL